MQDKNKADNYSEWACRALLTIHFLVCLSGYIIYLQTKYQLDTPLVPKSTINVIAGPGIIASLYIAGTFIISLWLYFLRKQVPVIVISSISIIIFRFLHVWLAF